MSSFFPPTVVVTAPIHENGIARMGGVRVLQHHYVARGENADLIEAIGQADALIVRGMPVTADLLDKAPRLKIVAKHGAGFDNIDVAAASVRGILVTTTGDANTASVAQLAVTLALAAQRLVPTVHASIVAGNYDAFRERIFPDLIDKTVGIVGFGNIGQRTARIFAGGFGSTILAFDPGIDNSTMAREKVRKIEGLDALVEQVDVLSLHLPLNDSTRHIISRDRLRRMKPNAVLVNTARGGVIDEAALFQALDENWIAAAGLDAFENEPLHASPLFELPNIVLSPHIGGATENSRCQAATMAAQAVLDVLENRRPQHLLNPHVWDARNSAPRSSTISIAR